MMSVGRHLARMVFLALALLVAAARGRRYPDGKDSVGAGKMGGGASAIEKITGVAAYISFGDAGPTIKASPEKSARDPDGGPSHQNTLYQMGSTSKSFPTRSS